MENSTTVRIDLQRLQILNDRLCQTLEALNQVRMSAHSVNTAAFGFAPNYALGFGGYPQPQQFWGAPVHSMIPSYGYGMTTPVSPWTAGINGFNGINPVYTNGLNPVYNTGINGYNVAPTMGRTTTAFAQPMAW